MVLANCKPNVLNGHVGDFDFPCSNKNCRWGINGMRALVCELCCFRDYTEVTLMHCKPCHIEFQEEDKKEEEDSDSDDDFTVKAWHKMWKPKKEDMNPKPALPLLMDYFRFNP